LNFQDRLRAALRIARTELLSDRTPEGSWAGELSSSALSTATAVTALAIAGRESPHAPHRYRRETRVGAGLDWLARHVNRDGGWGDTTTSRSNISTTTLCWAAFGAVPGANEKYRGAVRAAEAWLTRQAGGIEAQKLAPAIVRRYGRDRTFSVPILTACALSGRFGSGPDGWKWVPALPFELAALPHSFFAALRLPVVSYALPALIALGQARHRHRPSRNPLALLVRTLTGRRTLNVLARIQPSSGGFLEATPLTSFVVMSLAGSGLGHHPVTETGTDFLLASARDDGSWPIDTNLATWVTTLAVNALFESEPRDSDASPDAPGAPVESGWTHRDRDRIRDWLTGQQYRAEHPYTHAAPGGWAWTNLAGGVPDADDTAGALLALKRLAHQPGAGTPTFQSARRAGLNAGVAMLPQNRGAQQAVLAGIEWLLSLQNRDGGIPTFCRGWTNLPFDRSAPDLTAHALRAWNEWLPDLAPDLQGRVWRGIEKGLHYLARTQTRDGAWLPLWFGNEHEPEETNATYGTARVLLALTNIAGQTSRPPPFSEAVKEQIDARDFPTSRSGLACPARWHGLLATLIENGGRRLLAGQKTDGSWGAPGDGPASVEETALAVEALAAVTAHPLAGQIAPRTREAAMNGACWLVEKVESGEWRQPSPIGFYFAKLWYYERLYPQIFTVAALGRVADQLKCNL
jgi:squalene-hopene/tetraprenyl-beta-curcumene cyclase